MTGKVKVLFLWSVMVFLHAKAFSQSHFIFIQSEDKQPFSVRLNNKNYGSSGSGYVIIPQLTSGEYFAEVKAAASQQLFGTYRIVINYSDLGFNLRQEDGAWILENVQSKNILKNWVPEPEEKKEKVTNSGVGFGDMLSQVINDPKLGKKKDSATKANPEMVAQKTITETIDQKTETAGDSVDVNTSGVIKNSEDETKAGLNLVFVDFNQRSNDTISIIIPIEGSVQTDSTGKEIASGAGTNESETKLNIDSSKVTDEKKEPLRLKIEQAKNTQDSVKTLIPPTEVKTTVTQITETNVADSVNNPFHKPKLTVDSSSVEKLSADSVKLVVNPTVNPDCKGIANNDDFLKLRRKMTAQDNDEEMIDAAKKAFRSKCFTTDQIKNLGSLFLNDQSRYAFFDAAYSFVFDPGNFASLESQLIEEYYKKRFKAMLH